MTQTSKGFQRGWVLGFGCLSFGFRVLGFGCLCFGFRVLGFGYLSFGFRVLGFGCLGLGLCNLVATSEKRSPIVLSGSGIYRSKTWLFCCVLFFGIY